MAGASALGPWGSSSVKLGYSKWLGLSTAKGRMADYCPAHLCRGCSRFSFNALVYRLHKLCLHEEFGHTSGTKHRRGMRLPMCRCARTDVVPPGRLMLTATMPRHARELLAARRAEILGRIWGQVATTAENFVHEGPAFHRNGAECHDILHARNFSVLEMFLKLVMG